MPWKKDVYDSVCAGLRHAAAQGQFVPSSWIESIQMGPDGNLVVYGCGEGIIGWYAAQTLSLVSKARLQMVKGADRDAVDAVLRAVGLTNPELDLFHDNDPVLEFDERILFAYENRGKNPSAFEEVSVVLAEFFIDVMNRVAVVDEDGQVVQKPVTHKPSSAEQLELKFDQVFSQPLVLVAA
jgi:hypothetical protein